MSEERWQASAACQGQYIDEYYDREQGSVLNVTKLLCASCPVIEMCRIASVPEIWGYWAGMTQQDRRLWRRKLRYSPAPNDADVERFQRAADRAWRNGDPEGELAKELGGVALSA